MLDTLIHGTRTCCIAVCISCQNKEQWSLPAGSFKPSRGQYSTRTGKLELCTLPHLAPAVTEINDDTMPAGT